MNLEFLLIITDYFKTQKFGTFVYEILIPIVASACLFFFGRNGVLLGETFRVEALTLMGVMIGFSLMVITILATGNGGNIEKIKKHSTKFKIGKDEVSLFRLMLIRYSYLSIVETVVVIALIIFPILNANFCLGVCFKKIYFCLILSTVLHTLLLMIRNLTDLYFILYPNKKETN